MTMTRLPREILAEFIHHDHYAYLARCGLSEKRSNDCKSNATQTVGPKTHSEYRPT